jgi:hypothetical protein
MKKIFLFPRPAPPSTPKLKRKHMGNTLGTCWNKRKMKKIFLFPPSPSKLKRKKQDTLSAGLAFPLAA